jgi:hypothetical protein
MRYLPLTLLCVFAAASAAECPQDTSGVQRTKNFDYWINDLADDARTPGEYLNAAANYLYFMKEGRDLQSRFVNILRIRDRPIYFPACNDIGQCATVAVRSVPLDMGSFINPAVHMGYRIDVEFAGRRAYRFYQSDSRIFWSDIPAYNARDKRCRDNNGVLLNPDEPPVGNESDTPPSTGDGGSGDGGTRDDDGADDQVGIFWFFCRKEGTQRQLYASTPSEAEFFLEQMRRNGWNCYWQ